MLAPRYLVLSAAVATGLYAVHGAEHHAPAPAPAPKLVAAAPVVPVVAPLLATDDTDDSDDVIDESTDEDDGEEEMRGLAPLEDPAEFAMVFSVDGTPYLRLSSEEHASSHGQLRMIDTTTDEVDVVGNVATSAMPAKLRSWMGRAVLVDGTCTAHVVGFAEVSRVSGEPPGTEEYYYGSSEGDGEEGEGDEDGAGETKRRGEPPQWTIDDVREHGVTLAARLDGWDGTWARASEFPAAAIAHETEEPALESAALEDLLAKTDEDDELDQYWKQTGGEGDWRTSDSLSRDAHVFVHPLTNEKWVVASVFREGGCGDFGVSRMAVYHVTDSGKLHRVADLGHAGERIHDVIDIDGDGQPEIVFDDDRGANLVDLQDQAADSIAVDYVSYGCGC